MLCVATALLAGCGAPARAQRGTEARLVPPLSSPGSKMKLPCPHGRQARTTVGIEACAAMQERRLEHRINPLVVAIFGRMAGVDARTPRGGPFDFSFRGSARVRFIRAERSWVAYRAATCSSRADAMAGGSGSLDLLATCFVALDRRHLADLAAFAAQLGPS